MRSLPLIIVVGANDLAARVCEDLCETSGHEVLLIADDARLASKIEPLGGRFLHAGANDTAVLESAGVREAECIIPVGDDDRVNLHVALKARDLNPHIRVVLRQFNRALGRKIEQNLHGTSAISPATHAAATFAAACIDPQVLYGVQFPLADGPLVAFSQRSAANFGLSGTTVGEAERELDARITAVNARVNPPADQVIRSEDEIVVCAPVRELHPGKTHRHDEAKNPLRLRHRPRFREAVRRALRLEPLLVYTLIFGTLAYIAASFYFAAQLHVPLLQAFYFVAATMFTVGYGDITPHTQHGAWHTYVVAIGVMAVGVVFGGVFIASMASVLNRAQETALRGLRQINAEDHIIVCGAGNVGTRVIEFLLQLDQHVVVIEPRPNARILELARTRRIDLLASDATDDDTLAFCSLGRAHSVAAVTDSDTANLEAALGALAYNARLPVILRIGNVEFARSVARNFSIVSSFATSDLTGPVIAGLARFASSRGRVSFAGETFAIGERTSDMYIPRAEGGIPLFICREGELQLAHDFEEMRPGDRMLDIVPLSQFRTT